MKRGLSTTQIIVIVGLSIILIVVVVGLVLLLSRGETPDETTPFNDAIVVTDPDDVVVTDDGIPPIFYVHLNTLWTFENSDTPSSDAVFANYYENTSSMYATVEISGIDNPIYRSPTLAPGTEVKEVKLSQKVDPGAYDAICIHHILNDKGEVASTVQVALTIVVKN